MDAMNEMINEQGIDKNAIPQFDLKALGEHFIQIRTMLECSQERMAKAMGVDTRLLAQIERGEDVLTADLDTQLADFFFYDALKPSASKLREIHELTFYEECELRLLAYAILRHKMHIITVMRLRRCGVVI